MPRKVVRCSFALLVSCAAAAFAGSSTAQNPVATFSSPGTKEVTLQACNSGGCTSVVRSVTVLDPMPAITSLIASPSPVDTDGVVHLSGAGTGAPPLVFTWRVNNLAGTEVARYTGASADWTVNGPPGVYSIYLDLTNAYATVTSQAPVEVIVQLSPIIFKDGFEMGSTSRWQIAAP